MSVGRHDTSRLVLEPVLHMEWMSSPATCSFGAEISDKHLIRDKEARIGFISAYVIQ